MQSDAFRRVRERMENNRIDAVSAAEMRNEEVRALSPVIRQIDEELRKTGTLLFRTACDGKDIEPLRRRNKELNAARRTELRRLGLPEDYTDVHYHCPLCKDTGYVDIRMCKCLHDALVRENILASGMGRLIDRQSFQNFSLDAYAKNEENLARMKYIVKRAKSFAKNFTRDQGKTLFFYGKTGTGKTHLSTAIAKVVLSGGYDVIYDSAMNIVDAFANDRFRSGFEPMGENVTRFFDTDLLIIDDLGTELINDFTRSVIYNLLNTRQNRGNSTILSTNFEPDELREKYGDRVFSRIFSDQENIFSFMGEDYRLKG